MSGGGAPGGGTATGCDTSDLLVIHRVFRDLYARAPGLVAACGDDPRRHALVREHIDEITEALHRHHTGEDITLWDRLETRSPACALHVARMRAQHATVAEHLERVRTAKDAWRDDPVGGTTALVDELSALEAALVDHLNDEERTIRPLAGDLLTQTEWDELRDHGIAGTPKSRMLIQVGYLLRTFGDDEAGRLEFWNALPAVVRVLYRLFGERQLSRELTALYGRAA